MSSEKKIMLTIIVGSLVGALGGYFVTLPYVLAGSLICLAISGVGIILSKR